MTVSIIRLRELVVPLLMVVAIVFYLGEAIGLSPEALIFPGALIAVIAATLVWSVVVALLWGRAAAPAPGNLPPVDAATPIQPVTSEESDIGPILALKPWLLVAIPLVLVGAMDIVGALPALVVMVFAAQLVLGSRSLPFALLVAFGVALPVYGLFKYVLHARFPAGVLGLG